MNMLADETALPEDQCRNAKNLDFDKDGNYRLRPGFSKIVSATNVHSLHPSDTGQYLYGCQKNNIGIFDILNTSFSVKATMPSAFMTSWTDLDDVAYASNPAFNCRFDPITFAAYNVAVPLIAPPTITASTAGGMRPGTYTIAYSILNSDLEESPLSEETQIDIVEGGGIAISGLTIDATSKIRIYASQAHGEELYRALEAPLVASTLSLGHKEINVAGAQPETRLSSKSQ